MLKKYTIIISVPDERARTRSSLKLGYQIPDEKKFQNFWIRIIPDKIEKFFFGPDTRYYLVSVSDIWYRYGAQHWLKAKPRSEKEASKA